MEDVVNERERRHAEALKREGVPIPLFWFKNDSLLTLFFNASSVSIPEAERLVVATVEELRSKSLISGREEAMRNIIHEETAHSRVHDAYNAYLKAAGFSIDRHVRMTERLTSFLQKRFSLKTRLAICAMTEHFTASTSRQVLDEGIFEGRDIDERMDRVWTWHALEELDHRSTILISIARSGADTSVAFTPGLSRPLCSFTCTMPASSLF